MYAPTMWRGKGRLLGVKGKEVVGKGELSELLIGAGSPANLSKGLVPVLRATVDQNPLGETEPSPPLSSLPVPHSSLGCSHLTSFSDYTAIFCFPQMTIDSKVWELKKIKMIPIFHIMHSKNYLHMQKAALMSLIRFEQRVLTSLPKSEKRSPLVLEDEVPRRANPRQDFSLHLSLS